MILAVVTWNNSDDRISHSKSAIALFFLLVWSIGDLSLTSLVAGWGDCLFAIVFNVLAFPNPIGNPVNTTREAQHNG